MFVKHPLFVLWLLLSILCLAPASSDAQEDTVETYAFPLQEKGGFLKGISVVLYNNDSTMDINTPDFFDNLEERNLGVNSVILVFPIFQDGVNATTLYEDPILTPTEENLRIFVRENWLPLPGLTC